jgi:hypothetical protein
MNRKIECSKILGFQNGHGSCWNIVLLTLLLHSKAVGDEIQKYIYDDYKGEDDERIKRDVTNLLQDARCMLEYYFPKEYNVFKKKYIQNILEGLLIRFNKNYKITKEINSFPLPLQLVRACSRPDENRILENFFKFFS